MYFKPYRKDMNRFTGDLDVAKISEFINTKYMDGDLYLESKRPKQGKTLAIMANEKG
jgi:hypothetical protein